MTPLELPHRGAKCMEATSSVVAQQRMSHGSQLPNTSIINWIPQLAVAGEAAAARKADQLTSFSSYFKCCVLCFLAGMCLKISIHTCQEEKSKTIKEIMIGANKTKMRTKNSECIEILSCHRQLSI